MLHFSTFRYLSSNLMTILVGFIPVFKACPPCPTCVPIYAAILSLFGLKLADYSHYLLPVMLISMSYTLYSMSAQYVRSKRSIMPLAVTASFCAILLGSKYIFFMPFVTYFAMVGLASAVLWNHTLKPVSCCGHS